MNPVYSFEGVKFTKVNNTKVNLTKVNKQPLFLDSSMVEHTAVNRGVVGSSPTRGANLRVKIKYGDIAKW